MCDIQVYKKKKKKSTCLPKFSPMVIIEISALQQKCQSMESSAPFLSSETKALEKYSGGGANIWEVWQVRAGGEC